MRVLLLFSTLLMLSFDAFALSYADVCPVGKVYNWTGTEEFIRSRKCEFHGRCSIVPIEEDTWNCHSDFDSAGKSSCFYTKHKIAETDVNNCFTDDEDGDGSAGGKDDVIDLPEDWKGDVIANYNLNKLFETCNTLPGSIYSVDAEDCYRKGLINQREQLRQQSKHFAINDHQLSLLVKYMKENSAVIAENAAIARDGMDFQTNVINKGNTESNKLLNMINTGIANIQPSGELPESLLSDISSLSGNSSKSMESLVNIDNSNYAANSFLNSIARSSNNSTDAIHNLNTKLANTLVQTNMRISDAAEAGWMVEENTASTVKAINAVKSNTNKIKNSTDAVKNSVNDFKAANVGILGDIKGLTSGLGVDISAQKDYQKIIAEKISLLGDDFGRGIPELDKKSEINNNLLTDIKTLTKDNASSLTAENQAQLDKAFEQFAETEKQTGEIVNIKDLTADLGVKGDASNEKLDSILAAIQGMNGEFTVTTDNSDVVASVDGMSTDIVRGLDKLGDGIGGLTDSVNGIGETLDAFAEGDFASGTELSCGLTRKCKSYWSSSYPDGLSGVLDAFSERVKSKGFTDVLTIDLGSGSFTPKWDLCFNNIGNMSFGCFELSISDYIWGFIRAIMMFSTVLFCRSAVFGG